MRWERQGLRIIPKFLAQLRWWMNPERSRLQETNSIATWSKRRGISLGEISSTWDLFSSRSWVAFGENYPCIEFRGVIWADEIIGVKKGFPNSCRFQTQPQPWLGLNNKDKFREKHTELLSISFTWHCCCYSVAQSDSSQSHGLQHVRLPCPSLSPRVCSNSCPSISSSATPFSSCPQPFPASGFSQWVNSLC